MATDQIPLEAAYVREWHAADRELPQIALEIFDRSLALALAIVTAPLLLAAAVTVMLSSRRSPFIAHRRVGHAGRPLWILKLRTMWRPGAPARLLLVERIVQDPPLERIKPMADPRVGNRFAALCRRYSVDELPQLWQVVRGEMALIGPRPLTHRELQSHYGTDAYALLSRKPGITGLWQIRGRSSLGYRRRRRFDLFLHKHWSFRLYLHIALSTIPAVFTGRNAW